MHLLINLDGGGIPIPYNHSYELYSSLLNVIKTHDPKLAEQIHSKDSAPSFCMSELLPGGKREFTKDSIMAERYILLLSSLNSGIISEISIALSKEGKLSIGSYTLKIFSIYTKEIKPSAEVVTLVSKGPVVIKNNNKYLTGNDNDFQEKLVENIRNKYKAATGKEGYVNFLKILSEKNKLVKIKDGLIPCTMIKIVISADFELLEVLLNVGVGSKTQMGFGFLEEEKSVKNGEK